MKVMTHWVKLYTLQNKLYYSSYTTEEELGPESLSDMSKIMRLRVMREN